MVDNLNRMKEQRKKKKQALLEAEERYKHAQKVRNLEKVIEEESETMSVSGRMSDANSAS